MSLRIKSVLILAVLALVITAGPASAAAVPGKVTKEKFTFGDRTISYYIYVPKNVGAPASAPLLVLLHGSGRDGSTQVEPWKKLAEKEGIVLLAPNAANPQYWDVPIDGPSALCALVNEVRKELPVVNARRIYLFGHSAGAVFVLYMATFESEYFAAASLHAGAWREPAEFASLQAVRRKIPVAMTVGDNDRFFSVAAVNGTAEQLRKAGLPVDVEIRKGHDHNYYAVSDRVNEWAWTALKQHALEADPKYVQHQFQ